MATCPSSNLAAKVISSTAPILTSLYRPTKVDRVLHDGDEMRLGATVLVAHLTAGHTKGCTTWTMKVTEGGKTYDVVIVGGPGVNAGYKLVDNAAYPHIAEDYERMFRVLKSLPCDIFLGAHGGYFGLEEKYPRMKERGANPFVDPEGYKKFIAEKGTGFPRRIIKTKTRRQRKDRVNKKVGLAPDCGRFTRNSEAIPVQNSASRPRTPSPDSDPPSRPNLPSGCSTIRRNGPDARVTFFELGLYGIEGKFNS